MRWLFRLTEALFPTDIYCLCCGSVIDGSRAYALCDHCIGKVTWARGKTCAKCGKILAEDSPRTICHDCASRTHAFRKGYTCAQYNLYERAMMMDLKYRDRSYIGGKLPIIHGSGCAGDPAPCPECRCGQTHSDRREGHCHR